MPTLYIHLDESGNFVFNPRGTRYFVFTVSWTYDPAPLADKLTNLRFQLLKDGHNLQAFHATDDRQINRNQVVASMVSIDGWRYAAVVIEKAKVYLPLRDPSKFYLRFASMPLEYAFLSAIGRQTSKVMIFTDTLPIKENRKAVEKAIRTSCRRKLPDGMAFHVYHHDKRSNAWLQVTDYCCWGIQRKWEFNDLRTYNQLKSRLVSRELEVTRWGEEVFYQHPHS